MIIGVARASILMAKADQIYERLSDILERLIRELDTPAFDPDEAHTELSRTFKQLNELSDSAPHIWPLPIAIYDLLWALKPLPDNDKMAGLIADAMKQVYKDHLETLMLCATIIRDYGGGEIEWK